MKQNFKHAYKFQICPKYTKMQRPPQIFTNLEKISNENTILALFAIAYL